MKVLVIGGGGREHALAWKLKQDDGVSQVFVAPGNAGTARDADLINLDITDKVALREWAQAQDVALTVVGPEAPLAAGVVDEFRAHGLPIFGPTKAAAQLESSKAFSKAFMQRHGIPTAKYQAFTDPALAHAYVEAEGAPIVVKADGLAAGKGVIVAMTVEEALAAVEDMFGGSFGAAGTEVVIEEFMEGEEASLFVLCDGTDVLPVGTAQDHKRVGDGDTGPNTGGMGAYSPAPVLTEAILAQAMAEIVRPTVAEMARRGTPFQGVLYAGLMIKDGRARLVEYNVRFGDPECQVLMMRLGAQAFDLIQACAEGRLGRIAVNWACDHALTVVMAAAGYPDAYARGSQIRGLEELPEDSSHMVFHAGTATRDGTLIAAGGRVLDVTARGATLSEARDRAYAMVARIDWPGGFCRRDIGWRAL